MFCKENTNPFLLRKEVHAFLLKKTVKEKKNVLLHEKPTQNQHKE